MHGMSVMLLVSAGICASGVVLALTRMPRRVPVAIAGGRDKGQSLHAG